MIRMTFVYTWIKYSKSARYLLDVVLEHQGKLVPEHSVLFCNSVICPVGRGYKLELVARGPIDHPKVLGGGVIKVYDEVGIERLGYPVYVKPGMEECDELDRSYTSRS